MVTMFALPFGLGECELMHWRCFSVVLEASILFLRRYVHNNNDYPRSAFPKW
jgi:hypothetical protein